MENFDLRKYLAEGRLLKEDMASKAVSVLKSYKGEVKGLEDYIKYLMNTSDDISSSIQAVADDMDRDNDAEDSLRRDLEKLSLSEGKLLKENTNPIWTIEASEDDADISDAGLEYIRAVGTIIDKALPDISIEDMIASMDVINNFWYDEARKNAKGSEPEEIKVSAIDFADSVIEHYEDVIVFDNNNRDSNIDDDFDKRLNALIKDSRHPTRNLKYFSERHRNKFRNYAEKFLKPINASDSQIRSALFKYTIEYYDTKDI
jgi:hypothetical protein